VVFLFSGLAINAVSRSAGAVVLEVRRQFREFPGIMERTQRPEYGKVVDICTRDAQRELLTPVCWRSWRRSRWASAWAPARWPRTCRGDRHRHPDGVFLANSGGAWDNAKKWSRTVPTAARAPTPTPPRSSVTYGG
jgi:K(+)-stimulated pyrophosphate-energized sodium pump